jgi:hypothetical protein
MNWIELDECYRRAITKEMSIKEASDFISMTWHLVKFHTNNRNLWSEESNEIFNINQKKLLDLSIAVWRRMHDKE